MKRKMPDRQGQFITQKYRCPRHGAFAVGIAVQRTPPPGAACPKCKEIVPIEFSRNNPFRGSDFMKKVERR